MAAGVFLNRFAPAVVAEVLLAAIALVHATGFAVGYGFARAFGFPVTAARTIAIETGMQNSGLGAFLAKRHFPAEPLTAVPAAISALVHSVLGSALAAWWRLRPPGSVTAKTGTAAHHTETGSCR